MRAVLISVVLAVSACGSDPGEGEPIVDTNTIESGIYDTTGEVETDCRYATAALGQPTNSFGSLAQAIYVVRPQRTIRVPFQFSSSGWGTSERVDLEQRDYTFADDLDGACGATQTLNYEVTFAGADIVEATGQKIWSNIQDGCGGAPLVPVSDCTISGTFQFELKEACSEPCQVVQLPRHDPSAALELACECE